MTLPLWPLLVLAGVLGLAVGSFLNVVIHRVPQGRSVVTPASSCPGCATPIRGRHNVPVVSWLALRGRCASCAMRISARYPLVELSTGVLFTLITLGLGPSIALPVALYLAALGVTLTMIVVDTGTVPRSLLLPSCAVGALLVLVPAAATALP